MKTKFYHCPICGNVIVKLVDSNAIPSCCGHVMEQLSPNTYEGKDEYHLPVVTPIGELAFRVDIGHEPHPMVREHHISFIVAETWRGITVRHLPADEAASVVFYLDDTPVAFYAYCNVHGLWMTPATQQRCTSNGTCALPD